MLKSRKIRELEAQNSDVEDRDEGDVEEGEEGQQGYAEDEELEGFQNEQQEGPAKVTLNEKVVKWNRRRMSTRHAYAIICSASPRSQVSGGGNVEIMKSPLKGLQWLPSLHVVRGDHEREEKTAPVPLTYLVAAAEKTTDKINTPTATTAVPLPPPPPPPPPPSYANTSAAAAAPTQQQGLQPPLLKPPTLLKGPLDTPVSSNKMVPPASALSVASLPEGNRQEQRPIANTNCTPTITKGTASTASVDEGHSGGEGDDDGTSPTTSSSTPVVSRAVVVVSKRQKRLQYSEMMDWVRSSYAERQLLLLDALHDIQEPRSVCRVLHEHYEEYNRRKGPNKRVSGRWLAWVVAAVRGRSVRHCWKNDFSTPVIGGSDGQEAFLRCSIVSRRTRWATRTILTVPLGRKEV